MEVDIKVLCSFFRGSAGFLWDSEVKLLQVPTSNHLGGTYFCLLAAAFIVGFNAEDSKQQIPHDMAHHLFQNEEPKVQKKRSILQVFFNDSKSSNSIFL